jgi:hypothetical protein
LAIAGGLALAGCSAAEVLDRNSLEGWEPLGGAAWALEDGAIVGSGEGDGFIATADRYGDVRLSLEFFADATVNSGVFVRCQDRADISPMTCFENNIWDNHPKPEARTGAIVMRVMPPLAHVETVGKWSRFEVEAVGSRLTVKVDGQVTAVLEDADPTPGFIALQRFGEGEIRFRDIRIESLP